MTGTPTPERLAQLEARRDAIIAQARDLLETRQAAGITELSGPDATRFRGMQQTIAELSDDIIPTYRSELERAQIPERYRNLGTGTRHSRRGSAAALAPLGFGAEELRSAHARIGRGESVVLETRDPGFVSADSLIPPELYPIPTFPRHEDRLLDRLPGYALEVPSLEYVQVNSISGAAGVVGEGQPKPEITMPATKLVCTALKLAVHAGISWENWTDYGTFSQAVQTELMKQVIDLENQQLVYGDPTSGGLNGMVTTPGILTLAATGGTATPPNNFDDIAGAIARLRTGPALATPDLILVHPDTWAAVRTQKDTLGRYIATPDPTDDQAETAWGVDVLQSVQFTPGEAVLLDSTLVGRVAVRETLVLRLGYAGADFTSNVIRAVCEERLNLAVERPAAICHITGLPTAAPTTTGTKTAAKR